MRKKVVVIGAGPGGLAISMLLSSLGYHVEVFEKHGKVGGRNGAMHEKGFTFDIGPTFLSMPHIAEELFQAAGRNLHDYVTLIELTNMYELLFDNRRLRMYRDRDLMIKEIEKYYPGDGEGYLRFMSDTKKKFEVLTPLLQNKMDRYFDYISWRVLQALPHLSLGRSLFDVLSDYFSNKELLLAFTFQSKYLGMSPWECPGAFSILSYMEHEYGVYHPIGGLNQLSEAMAKVTVELGGVIHLGAEVDKLWLEGKKTKGIILKTGERIQADEVIINGDFAHVMTHLVPEGILKKYSKEKMNKKKYSCSTFMIYLGLNKRYDTSHHTICFAKDYKKNVEEITKELVLSEDPSIYIQNASVTDSTLATEGKSTLYILAPVPNNMSQIDWELNEQAFKELVYAILEDRTDFKDLKRYIEFEKVISPVQWESEMNVFQGATFSLGHQLSQMMVFRPHNKFEELQNTWLVGGGTHPGSGLPTILESARITAKLMSQADGIKFPAHSEIAWGNA